MLKSLIRHQVSVVACAIATVIIGIDFNMAGDSAHASIVDLTCPVGGETGTYSPGITNTPKPTNLTVDGSHSTCVSLSDSTIKSANYKFTLQGNLFCENLALSSYDIRYNFNNRKFSTVHYVSTEIVQAGGEIVLTSIGTVTEGEFQGDMVTRTITDTTPSPENCLTDQGLTSLTGVVTLTFTR